MNLPDPNLQQSALLIVMLGLGMLIGVASAASNIWKNNALVKAARNPARTPPPEEEAAKTFATKEELQRFRCEWQSMCRENHKQVDKIQSDIFNLLRAQQGELLNKLDSFHKELSSWQLGVERQIGAIDERTRK